MPVAPDQVLIAVGGIVGATAAFGLLTVAGAALIRRLRLAQDLPDVPRFEPPPPPLRGADEDPRAIAQRQAALRAAYARGLASLRAAQACQELVAALPADRGGANAAPCAAIERAATTAADAVARAERAIAAGGDALAGELAAAESAATAALAEADAAAARLPAAPRRRALLWALVGALVLAWSIAMLALLGHR